MWQKLKEQIPTILLTVLIVVGAAYWIHLQTIANMTMSQQQELAPLREQNDALKAASEDNRRRLLQSIKCSRMQSPTGRLTCS